jgi:hypothetical protein
MPVRLALTVILSALLGCVAYVGLLPWGDPCFLAVAHGEAGCPVVLSPSQETIRNVVFLAISLLVGLAAGLMSPFHRYLAGALSSPLSLLLAILAAHLAYSLDGPTFRMDIPGAYVTWLEVISALTVLGVIGAAIARFIRLTIVGGCREAQ